MKIPAPYFSGTPSFGDLTMERIIVEYVYPLLSVLKDEKNNRYLCMCFDTRQSQKWLVAPITTKNLIRLLKDEITLDYPFKNSDSIVLYAIHDYETREDSFKELHSSEIPPEYLPAPGEYLEEEDDEEIREYIGMLTDETSKWEQIHRKSVIKILERCGRVMRYHANKHGEEQFQETIRKRYIYRAYQKSSLYVAMTR